MIEIGRHIEILLLDNDCVIVPGLGGFMARYEEARLDGTDNMFLPPLRSVGFNPKLTLNDSLLAQSYVEAYDISYPDAVMRIDDEVRELRQHLENEGSYALNGIGVLRLNTYGNLEFEPCEAGILTPGLYGLSGFEMTPLSVLSAQEKEQHQIEEVAEKVEEPTEEEGQFVRLRVSWLRNLIIAAAAILAFLLLPARLGNDRLQTSQSGVDTRLLTQVMPKEVTGGQAEVKKALTNEALRRKSQRPVSTPNTVEEKQQKAYTLVLSSRIGRSSAKNYVEELHHDGFSLARFYQDKKGVKVVYGDYSTKEEALKALNKLNDNKAFADAWMMKYPAE